MKAFLFGLLAFVPTVAIAAPLKITNATTKSVSVGEYHGIFLPSICERTDYGLCFEEAFIKLKPYRRGKMIKGEVTLNVGVGKRETFIVVGDTNVGAVYATCPAEKSGYIQEVGSEVRLSDIEMSICLKNGSSHLIID